jgi:Ni/Fe-hydrogenase subunit HybB-like protein
VLKSLAMGKLFYTLLIIQACLGTFVPLTLLSMAQLFRRNIAAAIRARLYFLSSILILIGVLAMRWNVVIGGQLFSKSLRGFTAYKLAMAGQEGVLFSVCLTLLPFGVLWVLVRLFWTAEQVASKNTQASEIPV